MPIEQDGVGLLDAGDGGVEQVAGAAQRRIELGAVLAAVEALDAEPAEQILEREHLLGTGKVAGDGADALGRCRLELVGDDAPAPRPSSPGAACRSRARRAGRAAACCRPSQAKRVLSEIHSSLTSSLLRGRTRITSRPRVSTRMAEPSASMTSMDSVLLQLPRARDERPGPVRQRADRAQVVHVGRQLRQDAALEVGGDLHVLAAADGAQLLDAGDFRHEADAARAVDAAVHERLDQRADVLLFDGALVLDVARAAEAVGHRLVLQVALAALVADRAVERMVDEQEFHHAFARLLHQRAGGEDVARRAVPVGRQVGDAHGARGDGLGDALHLDQAHAAVAGDRQALVVAEARDLGAGHARTPAAAWCRARPRSACRR